MNKSRLLTISKTNLCEIAQAMKSLEFLYCQRTKRFETTTEMKAKIEGCLRALEVSYSASLGQLQKGQRLIYSAQHLQEMRAEAVVLCAFAMNNRHKADLITQTHKDKILRVFDLALARAVWLEEE